jgi:hypothetical protein
MNLIFALIGIGLIFFGILIDKFKVYWLISGYNTMSKEKKKNIDIKNLAKLISIFLYSSAAIFFIGIFMALIKIPYANEISLIIFLLNITIMLIFAQKYDMNNYDKNGKIKKSAKFILVGIITLLFVISGSIYYLGRECNVSVEKDKIVISGIYGRNILFEDIEDIRLESSIPQVLRKTNGMNVGDTLKGNFEVKDLGKVELFLNSKETCIYIYTDEIIILNLKDSQDTEQLYKLIKSRLN